MRIDRVLACLFVGSRSFQFAPSHPTRCVRRAASKAKAPLEEKATPAKSEAPLVSEPCNVVLTTTNADFDSLAAACALAALWERGNGTKSAVPTHVVMPRGACPQVGRFLAYHKHVLPVRGFKTIDENDVRALGVVDASSSERLGRAKSWISKAESVHVFDHHVDHSSADDDGTAKNELASWRGARIGEHIVEEVGSTTTILVERLRDQGILPKGFEATLYVLGIRADTGGLAYESTTARDAEALCWLLRCGASQAAVAEFGAERVSPEQRACVAASLSKVVTKRYHGVDIATVAVKTPAFVPGLAVVAEELLVLTAADVLVMAAEHAGDVTKRSWIDVIGRARPRAVTVDLRHVMQHFGGGGHRQAAAASIALDETDTTQFSTAQGALDAVVDLITEQIPDELRVVDFMTTNLKVLNDTTTIGDAKAVFDEYDLKSLVVVDEDHKLIGVLKLSDAVKAERRNELGAGVKGWMRSKVPTVGPDATVAELENILMLKGVGRLPVVDKEMTLLGIVTRTDILRLRNFYALDEPDR